MAWTTPRTWTAGETVTATMMNAHVRDNLNILKTEISDDGELLGVAHFVASIYADTPNAGASATALFTASISANLLSDGMLLRMVTWGTFANNGNSKSLTAVLGSSAAQTILSGVTTTVSLNSWRAVVEVLQDGTSSQRWLTRGVRSYGESNDNQTRNSATTEDETTALNLVFKATGGASSDIILKGGYCYMHRLAA